ncbi:helix-turn-helix domain-containing protein [Vibrio owensii]|uniref:helix-turn-helix domain-containing protein n=1 Tax=Vibrio owensii TaxID=696485 RepID=UPI000996DDAF|nr:helix-turn-helix transcriptional regulator [Vibrio owensii]AQW61542.1 transcriptional regulator [Vibrio owensii]
MFGQLLKDIRKIFKYTQKDLAAKLSLESEEFSQIDLVTISRWERGTTTPNNAKALRVIRCLTNDVRPFLSLLTHDLVPSKSLDEFIQLRYGTNVIQLTLAAFGLQVPTDKNEIFHDEIIKKVNDPVLIKIFDYHSLFDQDRLDLINIDLYLYHEERKLHGYRFYEASQPDVIIGSTISFILSTESIENEIRLKGCDIDLKKSVKYKDSGRFSLYMASVMITSGEVFKYNWIQQLQFLSTHSNIESLYVSVVTETVVPFLLSIGFEVVATKNPVKVGGIKIGRRRYERCLMKIDTSVLLTSKEALSLIADYL